jgi:hypothetical protein
MTRRVGPKSRSRRKRAAKKKKTKSSKSKKKKRVRILKKAEKSPEALGVQDPPLSYPGIPAPQALTNKAIRIKQQPSAPTE